MYACCWQLVIAIGCNLFETGGKGYHQSNEKVVPFLAAASHAKARQRNLHNAESSEFLRQTSWKTAPIN